MSGTLSSRCPGSALDLVAVPAIMSMINVALATAGPLEDGGEAQWPDVDWQRDVLHRVLPLMYPDRDPDAALTVAVRTLAAGEDAQDVQSRLLGATSRLEKATQHVRGIINTMDAEEGERS